MLDKTRFLPDLSHVSCYIWGIEFPRFSPVNLNALGPDPKSKGLALAEESAAFHCRAIHVLPSSKAVVMVLSHWRFITIAFPQYPEAMLILTPPLRWRWFPHPHRPVWANRAYSPVAKKCGTPTRHPSGAGAGIVAFTKPFMPGRCRCNANLCAAREHARLQHRTHTAVYSCNISLEMRRRMSQTPGFTQFLASLNGGNHVS